MTPGYRIEEFAHAAPEELIMARCRAFGGGDFAFIYDSYHPDSYFRRQFPDRPSYLAYARATLAADFEIRECRILRGKAAAGEYLVLFYLDTLYRGERRETFELARLLRTGEGWRYHSSQKLTREEFSGEIEEIDWEAFERVREKVFF